MDIVTVIPTRGLIYAQTIEGLRNNGINGFLTIEGFGIPDAQNEAAKRALDEYSSYILFIEDDVVMPDGALEQMIKKDAAIVAVDYPMDNGYGCIAKKQGEIMWCGLGCTLIKRNVFKYLPKPYFDISYSWRIISEDPFEVEKIDNPYKYGGQDINFFMRCRDYGFKIETIDMEAKHLRTKNGRDDRTNNQQYGVYALPKISKYQNYN